MTRYACMLLVLNMVWMIIIFFFKSLIGKDANDGEKRTKMILILERRKEIGKKRRENSNLKNKNKGKSREMDSYTFK